MNAHLQIEFRDGFVHVQYPAECEVTPENQSRLWNEITMAANRFKCRKVLSEAPPLPRRKIGTLDAINLAKQATNAAPGLSVACCLAGYIPDDSDEFFKTAALNRGMRIEFFPNREEAITWLGIAPAN